jgi:hypothetical protein
MTKAEFFADLQEIVNDSLVTDHLHIERENMWAISITNDLAQEITVDEFAEFIQGVIENRRSQAVGLKTAMTFYAWLDKQAAQFRFSVIPESMPLSFTCEIVKISDLKKIVREFLEFNFHKGFELSELLAKENEIDEPLDVYICKI